MNQVIFEAGTDGLPQTIDIFNAYLGFQFLEYEPRLVRGISGYLALPAEASAAVACVVGNVSFTRKALHDRGVRIPQIDYPLPPEFYGRELRRSTLAAELLGFRQTGRQVFLKPVINKLFPARLLLDEDDAVYFEGWVQDYGASECWASDLIAPVSEWRVFVYEQAIVGSRCYAGDFTLGPDYRQAEAMIATWPQAPIAYTLDLFVNPAGETFCMEVNDFWAIGSYGLDSTLYAQMLLSRWQELTGQPLTPKSAWLSPD